MSATYYTLCSSCKHASTCTFPRDPQKPSLYCEEFEIEHGLQRKKTSKYSLKTENGHITLVKEPAGLAGLCSDCENRQKCAFPKPEGGIWHCEEYQ